MKYRIAYAACRGTGHISDGIPCQDMVTGICGPEGAVIALADGAGSCPHAHYGARAAVDAAKDLLYQWCRDGFPEDAQAISDILFTCLYAMSRNPYPLGEQACTLLLCAADRNGNYLCAHMGDGYIFRVRQDGAQLLSDAERGSEPNETYFLTTMDAGVHLRLTRGHLAPGAAIELCSDGAGESLFDCQNRTCAPAVGRIASWLQDNSQEDVSQALEENLDELFRSNTSDDMSIAVLIRCTEGSDRIC